MAVESALSRHPRLRLVAWAGGLFTLIALFLIRVVSGAEFAFASLALLPVMWSAWTNGRLAGWVMALLAALTWIAGDLASDRAFSEPWVPWFNGAVHGLMYALVATVAAALRELLLREHDRATRDGLTGLLNRRHFLEAGAAEIERSNRHAHPLTVLYMDLDHFKQLNDLQGHLAGDQALKAVARALLRSARVSDLVARLGGDEFAVMLPEADSDAGQQVAQRLADTANAALKDFPGVTVSVGMACFGGPIPTVADMLKAADQLMYRAKQAGGGTLVAQHFPGSGTQGA